MSGMLAHAINTTATTLVRINEVKITQFGTEARILGVNGLSACSVVAIVSPYAAIVAHIGPNILGSNDPRSFIQLAEHKMREAKQLYRDNNHLFPSSSTYIVCAMLNGVVLTAPEHIRIMHSSIKQLNLSSAQVYYEQPSEDAVNRGTSSGTVMVDGRGTTPKVYVEDRDVTSLPQRSPVWQYLTQQGVAQYYLMLGSSVLVTQSMPPINEYIWMAEGQRWTKWNGSSWT
ncbi:hypothetical protein P153DRAFT_201887 [Dothidotthia symphoricarpi CBS 119687]|uniref:Uncharacterized protein n=1 Tax=Dothidotthia symphoricarpi CBS 119687 TaxID=1392245 RepID=A0A6A6AJI1_9PLEO|nr:uncharacterized protein P153DRAFT_201887 [Dothidotthia symphoricarpi CBS 119687]KAF2131726.1 hypothetical protein P153DRAFT_201887 [Dothidotthia symphoricarpi CBS 119687]